MASNVIAAFRWRESDLLKSGDNDVGRSENRFAVVSGIRAQEKTERFGIEAVVEVVKNLVEIVHAEEHLIGQARRKRRVQNHRVVVNVNGSDFEIVLEVGARGSQRRAASKRRGLAALSAEPTRGEVMLVREVVIEFDHAVKAIAGGSYGTEEVIGCRRQPPDEAPGPKAVWPD